MNKKWTFTSESVSEGHPDKMADQISDTILDAMLQEDAESRVACETLITTGLVVVDGRFPGPEAERESQAAAVLVGSMGVSRAALAVAKALHRASCGGGAQNRR